MSSYVKRLTSSSLSVLFAGSVNESGDIDGPALSTARFNDLREIATLNDGVQRKLTLPTQSHFYCSDGSKIKLIHPCSEDIVVAPPYIPPPPPPPPPPEPTTYHLGTPELIYSYVGLYYPNKVAPSGTGTLLVGFGDPSGAPTDGFIQELAIDGTDLGVFGSSYTRAPRVAIDTYGTDVFVANDYEYEVRKNNSAWVSLSSFPSGDFVDTPHLAIDQDNGTVWVTDRYHFVYEIPADGSGVTARTVGTSLNGLTVVDHVVYLCNAGSGTIYTWTPGVGAGTIASVALVSEDDTWDITYSPLTDRFYITIRFANTTGNSQKLVSFARTDPSDLVVDLHAFDLSGTQFDQWTVTYYANYLFIVNAAAKMIWRVPFVEDA